MPDPILPTGHTGALGEPIIGTGGGGPYYPSWDIPPTPLSNLSGGDPSGAGIPGVYAGNNVPWGSTDAFDVPSTGGQQGYTPSSVMQAYLDFYANAPQASGATAPGTAYPAPGTGSQASQGFLRRLLGLHPAGIATRAFQRALANNQMQANMAPRTGTWQGALNVPAGGALFGYNPNSGGAGGTPHYDYGTGNVAPTPSTNPLYTSGGAWDSVANAPQDVRFAQQSGTGNWQADQTTKAFELGGGIPGAPNRTGTTTDRGRDRFLNLLQGSFRADPEGGGFAQVTRPSGGPSQRDSRWVTPSQAEATSLGLSSDANARNEWLIAHNPWYYNNLTQAGPPPPTISGPPSISAPPIFPGA